jgi:hypothetical protein
MPRQSIEELHGPPAGFRVDERTDHPSDIIEFETEQSCVKWDHRRRRALRAYLAGASGGPNYRRALARLAGFMDAVSGGAARRLSAASKVQMRDWRHRVCGWLWSLVDDLGEDEWVFFSIVLPNWWVSAGGLGKVRAKSLTERLRLALYRAGAKDASGWLYAMIDGEFDGNTEGYTLHFHGIATEGMIRVLHRLRKQRQFRKNDTDAANYPFVRIKRKLQIERPHKPLPAPITYTSKSYQLQHDSVVDENGERRRVGYKHRIRRNSLVRLLLWQHRNRVKHQVLLIHLSVVKGALVPGKRGARSRT